MLIRKYKDSDQNNIIELFRINIPQYFATLEEIELVNYLNQCSDNYYVGKMDNTILGCGGFNLSENGSTAKIAWDFFHPQSQGKGLGTELTNFRIQKIKEIKSVKILTVRTSQLVYKFYERFGLTIKEIIKDYWAEGFDLYMMQCDINLVKYKQLT